MVNSFIIIKFLVEKFIFLVVRLSNRLEELGAKRIELENSRELVIRRMKQLHTQINNRRREGSTKLYFIRFSISSFLFL